MRLARFQPCQKFTGSGLILLWEKLAFSIAPGRTVYDMVDNIFDVCETRSRMLLILTNSLLLRHFVRARVWPIYFLRKCSRINMHSFSFESTFNYVVFFLHTRIADRESRNDSGVSRSCLWYCLAMRCSVLQ